MGITTPHTWFPQQMKEAEKRLRIIRKAISMGMGQEEIATRVGVSQSTVSRWASDEPNFPYRRHWAAIDAIGESMAIPVAAMVRDADLSYDAAPKSIANSKELRAAILEALADRDLNLSSLARISGVGGDSLKRLLYLGELNFFPDSLAAICTALDIDTDTLPISDPAKNAITTYRIGITQGGGRPARDIPIIGSAQAAELTVSNGQVHVPNWQDAEKVPAPTDGRKCLAFRVEGNSMYPRLTDDDIVMVDTAINPKNGDLAVVLTDDDEILIKQWRQIGDHVLLTSTNTAEGKDRELHPDQIRWAKKVTQRITRNP